MDRDYYVLLKKHHLKATPQRVAMLDIIYKHGHITIDNIYSALKKNYQSLSLSTVYKNILTLRDKGIVNELKVPNSKNYYELMQKKHHHLICDKSEASRI